MQHIPVLKTGTKIPTRTGKIKKVYNQKGEPKEKSAIFRRVCLFLKVPVGLPVKFYCFTCLRLPTHLPILSQCLSHKHQMERDDLHWAPQSQRKVTLLTDVCVQCSYPRLEKQHLVSVASICYKAAQKSARTSHSSLQKSVRKTTQHLGHMLRLKGLLRPGGWKCCV